MTDEKIVPIHGNTGSGTNGARGYAFSVGELIDAIEGSYGNINVIRKRLGVSRNTALKYILQESEATQLFYDERQAIVDEAEDAMVNLIKLGEPSMIRFALSSKTAKNRGWGSADNIGLVDGGLYENPEDRIKQKREETGAMTILTDDKLSEIENMLLDELIESNKTI